MKINSHIVIRYRRDVNVWCSAFKLDFELSRFRTIVKWDISRSYSEPVSASRSSPSTRCSRCVRVQRYQPARSWWVLSVGSPRVAGGRRGWRRREGGVPRCPGTPTRSPTLRPSHSRAHCPATPSTPICPSRPLPYAGSYLYRETTLNRNLTIPFLRGDNRAKRRPPAKFENFTSMTMW